MFLGGLWHGAQWTFVLWGLIHGSILVIERISRTNNISKKLPRGIKVFLTFNIISSHGYFLERKISVQHGIIYLKCLVLVNRDKLQESYWDKSLGQWPVL